MTSEESEVHRTTTGLAREPHPGDDAVVPDRVITYGEWLERIQIAMKRGEYLLAFDLAGEATEAYPEDLELHYWTVLTLARTGAIDQAELALASLHLEARLEGAPARLHEDIAALRARLAKDRALAVRGPERARRARIAAGEYEAIYQRLRRPYSCINAATMWLVAGEPGLARTFATLTLALCLDARPEGSSDSNYWQAATEAEAHLHLDEREAAVEALERAFALAADDFASLATTRAQLLVVREIKGIDTATLGPLAIPTVIHYGGHMIAAPGQSGRFPAEAEPSVAEAIRAQLDRHRVGFGFGSLACGADILFAEALLERGAEVHVVLPFDADEFKRVSVASGGAVWLSRFDRCLDAASSITCAIEGPYLGDDALFDYGARLAMGQALVRAAFLTTSASQMVVWDGKPPAGAVGTGTDVDTWRAGGRHTHVIEVGGEVEEVSITADEPIPSSRHVLRSLLFGDMKGFSALTDAQIPTFFSSVMGPLASTLDRFGGAVLHRNTWGDGIYVVLRDVVSAAHCTLALQETMKAIDLDALGLPTGLGLRIGAHIGPVFAGEDPVRKEPTFYGSEVTRTARIEPRTPEGEVYVTASFAAFAALEAEEAVTCQYVGHVACAKDYGTLPMYVLKRRL